MFTISNNNINEIIIKNSRFITIIFKIDDKSNIDNLINSIKKDYPKATHYCYAYILNDYKKSSDDKEPSGTAGIPMLSILEKENIVNVLVVVIRYFGGIKLGSGGLVRAYSKSVREILNKTEQIELEKGKEIQITFNYNQEKNIIQLLKDSIITKKEYKELIKYNVLVNDSIINNLKDINISYQIINNNIFKKK